MAINFNVTPYFDDYDETKQYYRILFRPGRAVQARELTQLQTSLQKQVERFGRNIFKEGSIVIPGQQSFDTNYKYVKLATSYNSVTADEVITNLIGNRITGANSEVTAIVVNAVTSNTSDPATIFVKYTGSGSLGTNTTFQVGEVITNDAANISVQVAASSATGSGTAFSVQPGAIFTKGVFAYFDNQTLVVEKYAKSSNVILGFTVTESTVTSADDTSLLDPAVGASNYIAPGADRYKIALDLSRRDLTFSASDDPNFIELLRVENGTIISRNDKPEYNILGDTLARRTFDESGNYTVKPYSIEIINHLQESGNNAARTGYLVSGSGGDDNKFVGIVTPGKSYIRGYEVENLKSQYLIGNKARDYSNVNNGIINTTFGNYILITNLYSVPDITDLPSVNLYNEYNSAGGTANGTLVGTAKIRGLEYSSGTLGATSAIYKLWLFDVEMISGYSFERNVKQIFCDNSGYNDFTADIYPSLTELNGSVDGQTAAYVTFGSTIQNNQLLGTGTRFTEELANGDYVHVTSISGQRFKVNNANTNTLLTAGSTVSSNVTGARIFLDKAAYNDTEHLSYIFEMPYETIKAIDPTNLETTYSTRRFYSRSLSSNTVTVTAGTDETFSSVTSINFAVFLKGSGRIIDHTTSGVIALGGSPTGKNFTLNLTPLGSATTGLSAAALQTADVVILSTVNKTNSASVKKTKTLQANSTVDFTTNVAAQASAISLSKADVYRIWSVKMSTTTVFGGSYSATGAVDITDRYELDNGQRITYYDVGTLRLKPNQPVPTNPIRVTFDYFTHGAGDYFTVDSYPDLTYDEIPEFTVDGKTYKLRDCLDFRPRIGDDSASFSTTGATVNEFFNVNDSFQTDYQYYLPRIDKIVINSEGNTSILQGVSSLNPREPLTPDDSMTLFVLDQKAYVFDVKNDIDVTVIDNRRYTMRDIGRIENRVKNLEYYTTLSLLEQDTQALQIQDGDGFDRFKNGFIVDNFNGHGIGDTTNRDYAVSIDSDRNELRPMVSVDPNYGKGLLSLNEVNSTTGSRTSNNYVISTESAITLPYSHVEYIKNSKASTTENINPFSIITWKGVVTLDPPGDKWFETEKLPDIFRNEEGNFNNLVSSARAKGTWGTVYGSWTSSTVGNQRTESRSRTEYTVVEDITKTVNRDVVKSKEVIPKMRSRQINFSAKGMKPNTRLRVFFDDISVTNFCRKNDTANANTSSSNTSLIFNSLANTFSANLVTTANGTIEGTFNYLAEVFNLNTGTKRFRLTDSPTNSSDAETVAETTFDASGTLVKIADEYVSTRNGKLVERKLDDEVITTTIPDEPPNPDRDFVDITIELAMGRPPTPSEKAFYAGVASQLGITSSTVSAARATITGGDSVLNSAGVPDPQKLKFGASQNYNTEAAKLFELASRIGTDVARNGTYSSNSLLKGWVNTASGTPPSVATADSLTRGTAAQAFGAQVALAIGAYNQGATTSSWSRIAGQVVSNGITATYNYSQCAGGTGSSSKPGDPLAQSFFVDRPLYLTKVDLFFSSKDENGVPVRIQIRKMVNGSPGSFIVPFSEKVVEAASVNVSDDGSTATTFSFDAPVFLEAGEYALVVLAESVNYRVWISQVGQTDVITDAVITEQPYVGVLFKSQNASTWNADQYQDLKFTLYRASFNTTVTGIVDFKLDELEYQYKKLEIDPLEVYEGSQTMRIYHKNHGMRNNDYIKLEGISTVGSNTSLNTNTLFYQVNTSYYGITLDELQRGNVTYQISNALLNSYTITLPRVVTANVTKPTRFGGGSVVATENIEYSTFRPLISYVTPAGTTVVNKYRGTSTSYTTESSYTAINAGEDVHLSTPLILASNVNSSTSMSGKPSYVHRLELSTTNEYVSPLIDTKQAGVVFVRNLINNPTYTSENPISNDFITIANSTNIVITPTSGSVGVITVNTSTDVANSLSMTKGTYINVSSASANNNGIYRIVDITSINSGANANISVVRIDTANIVSEAHTARVKIVNGRNFVAEEAAFDGSVFSKYVTRQVDFINPCTSFKIYADVAQPSGASVEFYYKVSTVGDTVALKDKEFTKITGVTITTSRGGEYYEVTKQVDNVPSFDAIMFKIVFLSSDTSQVPKVKKFRLVALA